MKPTKKIFLFHLLLPFLFLSCSGSDYKEIFPTLNDGKYDSEFPYKGCSEQLEEISNSIKFINCIAYYKRYTFRETSKIIKSDLNEQVIHNSTLSTSQIENTSSGTGLIIYNEAQKIAVLTCAHVVYNEDTLYYFLSDSEGNYTQYLSGIAVKLRASIYIPDFIESGNFEILAIDNYQDIAVISKDLLPENSFRINVFSFPFGKARELEWGSFVYAFGYPLGYKTITKAIVSSPNRDKSGSFIVDAFFNRGFSGGVVLAVRDGVPNFEFVGMIKSLFGYYDYLLVPDKELDYSRYNLQEPYAGKLFVDKKMNIQYGISKVVPSESVISFFEKNKENFYKKGYFIDDLYVTEK